MPKNNIFWNINKNSKVNEATLIEHTLKYGDFEDIVKLFKKIDKKRLKKFGLKIWQEIADF